ncbi:MAG: ThiF family adenylyltransferase [Bacteroidota bacterium]
MMMDARYARQMALPGWGSEGQRKLRHARVLVVGAGGLGSGVLVQLAASGVGTITVVDHDVVALGNLHRQTVYAESDIGINKAEAACKHLLEMNSSIQVMPVPIRFDHHLAEGLLSSHDIVLDCTDDPATKLLIDEAAAVAGIPCVYAALFRFEGQVSVFHHSEQGERWSLRSVFPDYLQNSVADCALTGIAGPVASTIASLQAMEAIKLILGIGRPLIGQLLCMDLLSGSHYLLQVPSEHVQVPVKRNDWNSFKARHADIVHDELELSPIGLDLSPYFLIDIREEYELTGPPVGLHLPMGEVMDNLSTLSTTRPLLLLCQKGPRSAATARMLRQQLKRNDVFSLQGGCLQLDQAR